MKLPGKSLITQVMNRTPYGMKTNSLIQNYIEKAGLYVA